MFAFRSSWYEGIQTNNRVNYGISSGNETGTTPTGDQTRTVNSPDPYGVIPKSNSFLIALNPSLPRYIYLYSVSQDKSSYNVWATLENSKDPRIYNNTNAQCKDPPNTPPPDANGQNYCGAGF